jgi:hypothetical protein
MRTDTKLPTLLCLKILNKGVQTRREIYKERKRKSAVIRLILISSDKHHKVKRSVGTHSELPTEILTPSKRAGGGGKKIRIQSMEIKFLRSIIGNARRDKLQE